MFITCKKRQKDELKALETKQVDTIQIMLVTQKYSGDSKETRNSIRKSSKTPKLQRGRGGGGEERVKSNSSYVVFHNTATLTISSVFCTLLDPHLDFLESTPYQQQDVLLLFITSFRISRFVFTGTISYRQWRSIWFQSLFVILITRNSIIVFIAISYISFFLCN